MSYTALRKSLAEGLRTAYKLGEDDIAKVLPENEEDFKESDFKEHFLKLDKDRIAAINEHNGDKFEQGIKKGEKNAHEKRENEIREAFDIDPDKELKGIDLVNKVIELNAKKTKADPSKLSDEELKSHPSVIKLLNEKDKSFKTREQELKDEYDSKIASYEKQKVVDRVDKKALSLLDELNLILPEDSNKAKNQKGFVLRDLKDFDWQEDGDDLIPLKDGKRHENDHGHAFTLKELVKSSAEKYFDFKKADDRDTPPAGGDGGSGNLNLPKTEEEYAKIVNDSSRPLEERQKIRDAWNQAKSQS